jgi:hypothetical protein
MPGIVAVMAGIVAVMAGIVAVMAGMILPVVTTVAPTVAPRMAPRVVLPVAFAMIGPGVGAGRGGKCTRDERDDEHSNGCDATHGALGDTHRAVLVGRVGLFVGPQRSAAGGR